MRIAIVADIHGNLTAFEAVLADLRQTSPDLVFHGGDLADAGSSPVEIVDQVRALGWQGVRGNTDEMLATPDTFKEFASQRPHLQPIFTAVEAMATLTRARLGEGRLEWLRGLPSSQFHGPLALVHASPESPWKSPLRDASDAELESVYKGLGKTVAVYGHIHQAYIRNVSGMIVANSGSVSLSYDGDRRASYFLLNDGKPEIRRVEYDVEKEIQALAICGMPHADWVTKILRSAGPVMP
jgi:predicted phosphodiesterase